MQGLTEEVPKPMLLVHGKTLLVRKLDILPENITEVIFIIGYHGAVIREAFGSEYAGKKITYVEQNELNGTMGAVSLAKSHITGKFIVMMGDDLYGREEVLRACQASDWAVVVEKTESMASGGKVLVDEDDVVVKVEEGNHHGTAGLMNTNLFVLDERIFEYPMVAIRTANGKQEYGLPQTVVEVAREAQIPLHAVYATSWIQITAPEDLERAENLLAPH
jgi:bifunctional UDP-N-acetylglucosamine pyrophosphorylase/glucosamine-1-phosphate N-acetyltransferase